MFVPKKISIFANFLTHAYIEMEKVTFKDLGRMPYQQAWDYQHELLKEVVDRKLHNRHFTEQDPEFQPYKHYLLFCDHPHVYTLGKSGSLDNLLLNEKQLAEKEIDFFKINRGGDITYHGPGQIVGYPIFDLDRFFTDVHKYVRFLEEAVIRTMAEYGLEGIRIEGFTGVWLSENETQPKRKICAIGVHLRRWVTLHGFAFNVNSDLNYFKNIIPCGIEDKDKDVTSLAYELGKKVEIEKVKEKVKKHFQNLFKFEFHTV